MALLKPMELGLLRSIERIELRITVASRVRQDDNGVHKEASPLFPSTNLASDVHDDLDDERYESLQANGQSKRDRVPHDDTRQRRSAKDSLIRGHCRSVHRTGGPERLMEQTPSIVTGWRYRVAIVV